jgi:hypothetical protein
MEDRSSGEFSLAPTLSAVADAKDAFVRFLEGETEAVRDRALLLISELVSRGAEARVAAADATIAVKVLSDHGIVRVELRDSGSGLVLGTLRRPSGSPSYGWSPHLLTKVADRWGLVSGDEGAWVWFELDLPDA